jgi:hypothetical protein
MPMVTRAARRQSSPVHTSSSKTPAKRRCRARYGPDRLKRRKRPEGQAAGVGESVNLLPEPCLCSDQMGQRASRAAAAAQARLTVIAPSYGAVRVTGLGVGIAGAWLEPGRPLDSPAKPAWFSAVVVRPAITQARAAHRGGSWLSAT